MKQYLLRVWQCVKAFLKWSLIQYAVLEVISLFHTGYLFIWSLFSDYNLRDLAMTHRLGTHGFYGWDDALIFAIPVYTVLFCIWHAFFKVKKQWWTIFISWGLYLVMVSFNIAKGLGWNYKIITVDEYMLASWLSPFYGAIVQVSFLLLRKKRTAKREGKEFDSMVHSILGMYDRVSLTYEEVESHLKKVTEEELENLISISKPVTHDELSLITRSLEEHPDSVYLLKKFNKPSLNKEFAEHPENSGWKILSFDEMNKDYFVFYFDSFGLPETHLCARAGYALYDFDKKEMVAHAFMRMS